MRIRPVQRQPRQPAAALLVTVLSLADLFGACEAWCSPRGEVSTSSLITSSARGRAPTTTLTTSTYAMDVGILPSASAIAQSTRLYLSATPSEYEQFGGDGGTTYENNAFRTFLNQCCVQSFMFLLQTTRDPHTIRWLNNFTKPVLDEWAWKPVSPEFHVDFEDGKSVDNSDLMDQKVPSELLRFHGLAALNTTLFPTWEDYFLDLLKQPDAELIIETWDPRVPEYTLDINPASLCSRMISVREQIAREFAHDLGVIATMGQQIFTSYWSEIEKSRGKLIAEREAAEAAGTSGEEQATDIEGTTMSSSPSLSEEGELKDSMSGFSGQWLGFLEWDPYWDESDKPSPLRRGNFDLMVLLATQEAVRRLINEGVEDETPEHEVESTNFLRNFYADRMLYFVGPQRYRRADEFVEELMLTPPVVIAKDGGNALIVNPLNIAELLLIKRDNVASEWQQIAKETPQEHSEIRRMQLDRMMGRPVLRDEDMMVEEGLAGGSGGGGGSDGIDEQQSSNEWQ